MREKGKKRMKKMADQLSNVTGRKTPAQRRKVEIESRK
jgi:hypothetical protein